MSLLLVGIGPIIAVERTRAPLAGLASEIKEPQSPHRAP
jgi:hypothetical protein